MINHKKYGKHGVFALTVCFAACGNSAEPSSATPGTGGSTNQEVDGSPDDDAYVESGGSAGSGGSSEIAGAGGSPDQNDAGQGGPDSSDGAAPMEAGGKPNGVRSNTPDATFTQLVTGDVPDLFLLSSNLHQKPSGSQYFLEWYGEVANFGTKPACHVQLDLSFKSSDGTPLIPLRTTFADAEAYQSILIVPCIPPGKTGGMYTNNFEPALVPLTSIAKVDASLRGNVYPDAVPSPLAPQIASANIIDYYGDGTSWSVAGTMKSTGDIYNILTSVYPINLDGLVVDQLSAVHLDALPQGMSWDFKTLSYDGPKFVKFLVFTDFLEGLGSTYAARSPGWQPQDFGGADGSSLMARTEKVRQTWLSELRARKIAAGR
jgi:hypothetical protein